MHSNDRWYTTSKLCFLLSTRWRPHISKTSMRSRVGLIVIIAHELICQTANGVLLQKQHFCSLTCITLEFIL